MPDVAHHIAYAIQQNYLHELAADSLDQIKAVVLLAMSEAGRSAPQATSAGHNAEVDAKLGLELLPPIRVPVETARRLRAAASAQGVILQALVREILAERLAVTLASDPAAEPVALPDEQVQRAMNQPSVLDADDLVHVGYVNLRTGALIRLVDLPPIERNGVLLGESDVVQAFRLARPNEAEDRDDGSALAASAPTWTPGAAACSTSNEDFRKWLSHNDKCMGAAGAEDATEA
jgi:hypothetical protein